MSLLLLYANDIQKAAAYTSIAESRNVVSSRDREVVMIEIAHPDIPVPARFVRDNQDITSDGHFFSGIGFDITLPDDFGQGQPKAKISIDNVGREMTTWIEASGGGQGATVRIMIVSRSAPDVLEMDITMSLSGVRMTALKITGTLGFDDILNMPAVTKTYRPETAHGLF